MKCSLTSIADALGQEFPMETCGNLDLSVTDVQELSETQHPTRPDVLYVAHQSQLLHYDGPTVQGPVLCISHTRWNLSGSRSNFPVLIMVLSRESGQVYAALNRFFYHQGQQSSELSEISGAFLRCRSLDALVDTGYGYLGNPFAILDSDGMLLSYAQQAGLGERTWQNTPYQNPFSSFNTIDHADLMERSRRDQSPVLINDENGPPQLRMALSSRGQSLGYLVVTALFRPFRPMDFQIVELLGCFVTLDLLRQNSIARTSVSDAGRLKNFLESGENNTPDLPQWLEQQQCSEGECYELLLINTLRQSPFWDIDELLARMDQLFPGSISTRLEAGLVVLVRSNADDSQASPLNVLAEHLPPILAVGCSTPFQSLAASGHAALRQARQALTLGSVLDPELRCYRYTDYAIYAGLRAASERIDLWELLPAEMKDMLEWDKNGEMLRTLEVYLSTGAKKAKASELLFIHLNTLKYRLNQLSKRLHADLDDPSTLFSLQYALHVIRYIRHFNTDSSDKL